MKDIQNIMMYQNTSWNGNNVNIQLPDINWAEIEKLKNRDWLGELKHSQELALKGLENVAKLKDNKYLKDKWIPIHGNVLKKAWRLWKNVWKRWNRKR